MKAKLTVLLLFCASMLFGQTATVTVNQTTKVTQPPVGLLTLDGAASFMITRGSGDPNGIVTASTGSMYLDQAGAIWFKQTGTGNSGWTQVGTGTGVPGGSDTQVQYNNGGVFGGIPYLTYNGSAVIQMAGTGLSAHYKLADSLDLTKTARFNLANISPNSSRIVTIPDTNSVTVVPDAGGLHQFLTSIDALGAIGKARPDFTDLTGNIAIIQMDGGSGATSSTFWRGDGTWAAVPGVTIGGSDTQVQFNDGGSLGGDAGLTYSKTADKLTNTVSDAATTTQSTGLVLDHASSGTPSSSFGTSILFNGQSSTTPSRTIGQIGALWSIATDTSRKGVIRFQGATTTGLDTSGVYVFPDSSLSANDFNDHGIGVINAGGGFHSQNITTPAAGLFLESDGSAYKQSPYKLPSAIGTAGQLLRFNGSDVAFTAAQYPNTAGASSNVLTSDGTNWVSGPLGVGTTPYTTHGDSNYSILTTDRIVVTSAALTTIRTWLLPLANAVAAGTTITVWDMFGGQTSSNYVSVGVSGSDRIWPGNNVVQNLPRNAYGGVSLTSDGVSKWFSNNYQPGNTTSSSFLYYSNGYWGPSPYTMPGTAGTAGGFIRSDGTNYQQSPWTLPVAPPASGRMLQSNSTTSSGWSTPSWPTAAGTSGKIVQSDGTNFVTSTPTYPLTAGTSGNVLTSDGTNWLSSAPAGGGGGTPGGSTTQYQYNNAGAFGGVPSMTYDGTIPATITLAPAANTYATGLLLADTTAASNNNQQYSPSIIFSSRGWETGTNVSRSLDYRMALIPFQGNPILPYLEISGSYAGAAYNPLMRLVYRSSTTGQIYGPDGNSTNPSFAFISDAGMGMYRAASTSLGFTIGGQDYLKLTTSYSYFKSPQLDFGGTGSEGNPNARMIMSNNGSAEFSFYGGGGAATDWGSIRAGVISATAGGVADALTLTRVNNVGTIGNGGGESILFRSEDTTTNDVNLGRINAFWTNATHNSNVADISFDLDNGSTTPAEAFRIKASGTLGLKTQASAPGSPAEGWLYGNSTDHKIYYYNGSSFVDLTLGSAASAPVNATYITQTADATLTNEQALGSLATGLLKNTTTTGVLSIATAKTDYWDTSTFVASGASHAIGLVPDPGATTGTTKFLREDATWVVPGGGGTVTNFTAGNLSPLFTTSVANPTSAPALTFTLSTAAANTVLSNNTGSTAAPAYVSNPGFTAIANLTSNGFVKTGGGIGTLSVDTSTYLTGNQTITLTGPVTGSGATSIATTIGAGQVTNSNLVNSSITIAGTSTALGGSITQDTITGLSALGIVKRTAANTLGIAVAKTDYWDTTLFAEGTTHNAGLVPDPGATTGTTKFLREDATWAVPAGGGGAPTGATYITSTADATLTSEFALGTLATGLLKNTTSTGIPTIAVAGTDYLAQVTRDAMVYVNPTTGSDGTGVRGREDKAFATIQGALNAASAGDTVVVAGGTYDIGSAGTNTKRVVVPANVNLRGAGRGVTIIKSDMLGTSSPFTGILVPGNNSVIADLSVIAYGTGVPHVNAISRRTGAAESWTNVRVERCHLYGLADCIIAGGLSLGDMTFVDCLIESPNDMFMWQSASNAVLIDCELRHTSVTGNTALSAVGIYDGGSGGTVKAYGCRFTLAGLSTTGQVWPMMSDSHVEVYDFVIDYGGQTPASGSFDVAPTTTNTMWVSNIRKSDNSALTYYASPIEIAPVSPKTVAKLPTVPQTGQIAAVTDGAASLAYGATVSGGGSTKYYVWYDGANWKVMGGGTTSGAPTSATYITQTADATLTAEQALGSLATGLLKNTTSTGVLTIATAKTDFWDTSDFVASGASHAHGLVPDPGASAGTTKFLREDATWATPAGGGNVSNTGTPTNGQLALWTNATTIQGVTALPAANFPALTGDVTTTAGSLTTTLANIPDLTPAVGSILFTNIAAPASPAATKDKLWFDTTDQRMHDKNNAGTIGTTAVAKSSTASQWFNSMSAAGVFTASQPAFTDISGTAATGQIPALGGNPTVNVTLSAQNGSATTYLRSDGAPALSQAIAPTWTGVHTFSPAARSSGTASYFTLNIPADTAQTAATESIGYKHVTATRQWATTGTVALQRENYFAGPTYSSASASQTFTDAFTMYLDKPIAGTNAIFTRGHTLGIIDSTSAASSITGGLVVATTLGTSATSVGIGGGNINAGGTITGGSTINAVTGYQLNAAEFPTAANGLVKRTGANAYTNATAGSDYEAALGNPGTSGFVLSSTTGGTRSWVAQTAPGGSNQQLQYNNSSAFGGIPYITYDGTNVTAQAQSGSTPRFRLADVTDNTKIARFDLTNITTGNSRTVTIPDSSSITVATPAIAGTNQFATAINGTTGVVTWSTPPTFVASGASHAVGYVPDPGSTAGTTKFLREDATWVVPSGGSATPGGSNTQIQYNDSGAFNGDAALTFTKASGLTTFKNGLTIGIGPISSGAWIDLPTSGPSGIGTGGAGSNPFLAYCSGTGNWFTETVAGDIGIRNASGNRIYLGITGAAGSYAAVSVNPTYLELGSSNLLAWSSTNPTNGTVDTALGRNAAGVVEVNNGTAGQYRTLKASGITLAPQASQIGNVVSSQTIVTSTVDQTATAETAHVTYTVPANACAVGSTFRITAWGNMDNGTTAITFTPRVRWGGTSGTQLLATPTVVGTTTALTNKTWKLEGLVTIITTGATGTATAEVALSNHTANTSGTFAQDEANSGATAVASVDTTTNKDLVLTWALSATTGTPHVRTIGGMIEMVRD